MIEEPKTLRVARALRRPTAAQVAAFDGLPAAVVLDAMHGAGALSAAIAPLPGQAVRVCGPALVAGNQPGDVLATLAALERVEPGDVLMVAVDGYAGAAAAGDRVAGMARNGGAAALVTDGPLRDLDGLRTVGLPAWCAGLTPASPVGRGPGTVGLPVDMGGARVAQGDVVVADVDGVVVVPFERLDAVAEAARRVMAAEAALDAEVEAGRRDVGLLAEHDARGDVEWVG
ncbi:RraA family protein [Jannaschia sp. Os4]|uniref:RraA family protein n=1 Tax=Jannaschia sp. Os4 TaxID=2807617 RepID=UPI001939E62C|nr:RraA family protein [Jannaschia sp. Os4]MBM2577677.1 RraA family protein [Jannaschia sp. Os4]